MKILILGSEGFIGRHLVRHFIAQDWKVYGCDLFEAPSLQYQYYKVSRLSPEMDELFQSNKYDACINAAGSGNVPYSIDHPLIDFESNSLDTMRILDALRKFQPACKYLHISSAAVYGNPQQLPVTEVTNICPISPYGWHKWIAENLCREYSSVFKLRVAIVRPFSVFGPGLKKQLFWDLLTKWRNSSDRKVTLWGNGSESRDFIYVEDLARSFETIINASGFQCEVYNIASGVEISVKRAATTFLNSLDPKMEILFSQSERVGDPSNWRADISKLRTLGFQPQVSFDEGISKLLLWMKGQGL